MLEKLMYGLGGIAALMIARNTYVIAGLPEEVSQGMIFKIIFFHAPMAITAMIGAAVAMFASVMFLVTKKFFWDSLAVAVTEVGLAFLAANLITGSIWARVIWGVWWVWDLRLTSALICWLLYAGYLMLRHAIEEPTQRATFAAVFSIFAFIDVPIVYLSIRLFRTQHPGAVFFSSTGSFPPDWSAIFGWNLLALMMLSAVMIYARLRQEEMHREIASLRRTALAF